MVNDKIVNIFMQNILNQFAIWNEVEEAHPLRIGFINDSYVVPAKRIGEPSYCLQRINHRIFKNVEGLMRNIELVTSHIREKLLIAHEEDIERKVLQLIPTKKGKLFYKSPEGDYWRLYVLVEPATSQEKVTPEAAELTGEAFGRFQCQLADLPFDALCESIPNFHNMEFRLQELDEAIDRAVSSQPSAISRQRLEACGDIVEWINRRREEMCRAERLFREGKLKKHINHCDTKVNNVLFDEKGKPICIVDLDTVMPGFVFSDFGDFMRTAANTGLEDDPNLDNIHVDLAVFEAYTRGYLKEATFLTDLEKEMLPFGCRLLSYMQTVRFFTDYINGDTYYKIQYPEHNLVRTRAQLRLVEEQEKVAEEMLRIVKSLNR